MAVLYLKLKLIPFAWLYLWRGVWTMFKLDETREERYEEFDI
jgi:hypothetical protein